MPKIKETITISVARDQAKNKDALGALACAESIKKALINRGFNASYSFIDKKDFLDPQGLKEKVNKNNPVCIFNLFEGFCDDSAKEAEFVKVLEASGIPFTGNPSAALEICLNKQKVKNILRRNKIPVPAGIFIDKTRSLDIEAFNFPLFIKPCFQDASVGIEEDCLVLKKEELLKTINSKLKRFPKGVLVEEFIDGKEYNAAFLGSFPYELLGIGKLDYQRHENLTPFLTYASKWEEAAPEFKKLVFSPCLEISDSLKDEIVGLSQRAAEALGCSGYFRVDFREKNNRLSILDVNPNPDINPDSGFISQARRKGYSYIGILEKILELKHKTSEALK